MSSVLAKPLVLVVDDSTQTLKLVRFLLEDAGYRVIAASSSRMASKILEKPPGTINLIILDVVMPGMDGLEICRRIREAGDSVPIIFLSARCETETKAEGLRLGADDYVTKPFFPNEFLARVEAVLRRAAGSATQAPTEDVIRVGEVELHVSMLKVKTGGGRQAELTPAEAKLLHCLMRNAGMTLSRNVLIDQAWERDSSRMNDNAVDVYIRRLRRKVEIDPNDPRYIRTIRGTGFLFHTA